MSHPVAGTSAEHDTQIFTVSDGEVDKDGAFGKLTESCAKSIESLGAGSQSSDSGFSQGSQEDGSQEILSQSAVLENDSGGKDRGGGEVEVASNEDDDDSLSTDSGTEQDEGLDTSIKRRKINLKHQSSRKSSTLLDSRRQEVPSSIRQQTIFGANKSDSCSSVCPTPEGDSGSTVSGDSLSQTPAMCNLCCVRPKNACFIHGQISHQVCCYRCAKMIFKNRGTCPVCRRRIEKITKNIVH